MMTYSLEVSSLKPECFEQSEVRLSDELHFDTLSTAPEFRIRVKFIGDPLSDMWLKAHNAVVRVIQTGIIEHQQMRIETPVSFYEKE
jgi:hypothetical protein